MRQPVPAEEAVAPSCARTMAPKFIEPVEMITPMMIRPMDTS
jgi:hypothetical protein